MCDPHCISCMTTHTRAALRPKTTFKIGGGLVHRKHPPLVTQISRCSPAPFLSSAPLTLLGGSQPRTLPMAPRRLGVEVHAAGTNVAQDDWQGHDDAIPHLRLRPPPLREAHTVQWRSNLPILSGVLCPSTSTAQLATDMCVCVGHQCARRTSPFFGSSVIWSDLGPPSSPSSSTTFNRHLPG